MEKEHLSPRHLGQQRSPDRSKTQQAKATPKTKSLTRMSIPERSPLPHSVSEISLDAPDRPNTQMSRQVTGHKAANGKTCRKLLKGDLTLGLSMSVNLALPQEVTG